MHSAERLLSLPKTRPFRMPWGISVCRDVSLLGLVQLLAPLETLPLHLQLPLPFRECSHASFCHFPTGVPSCSQ